MSPMDFTATIFSMVRDSGPGAALRWVDEYVDSGHIEPNHYRVIQGRAQIADAKAQEDRFKEQAALPDNSNLSIKVATPVKLDPRGGIPSHFWSSTPEGLYQTRLPSNPLSDRFRTEHLPQHHRKIFEDAKFGDKPNAFHDDRVFVGKGVQLSATGWSEAMAVTGEGNYHPTRSGRLSRLTGRMLLAAESQTSEMAYILPFPYVANNYYHSLAEMVYGLRHIYAVSDEVPIVYDLDPFSLLPAVCRNLGINPERLVPRAEVQERKYDTAVMPDPGPYYWSGPFANFFRSVALKGGQPQDSGRRLYISRAASSRNLRGEDKVASKLSDLGFSTIYAENYTFEQQMGMFATAEIVVAAHGAGVANICFGSDRCAVIEIFVDELINRDFQKRSQFVTDAYYPLYMEDDKVEELIDQLTYLIERIE